MNRLKQILRSAFQNRAYAITSILGLALGITGFLMVFMWVYGEMGVDKGLLKKDAVYRLEYSDWVSMPTKYRKILDRQSGIECYFQTEAFYQPIVKVKNESFKVSDWLFADPAILEVLKFEFIRGEAEKALEDPNGIILTRSEALSLFGSVDVYGEELRVENQYLFHVSGIIEDPSTHLRLKALGSLERMDEVRNAPDYMDRDNWNHLTYLLLTENTEPETLVSKLDDDRNALYPKEEDAQFLLRPFEDIYFASNLPSEYGARHGSKSMVLLFSLVCLLVLLISCFNIAILTVSRSFTRIKGITIRKLSGAGRGSIIVSFFGEVLVLVLLAFLAAGILVVLVRTVLPSMEGMNLSIDLLHPVWLIVFLFVFTFTLLTAGLFPALYLSKKSPLLLLKGGQSSKGELGPIQKGLIIFQFIIALSLMSMTLTVQRQIQFLKTKDLGFQKEDIIMLTIVNNDIATRQLDKKELLRKELLKMSSIESVTFTQSIPGDLQNVNTWTVNGEDVPLSIMETDPDFCKVMGIELQEGRPLDWDREGDKYKRYIINPEAARLLGYKEGADLQIRSNYGSSEIIGVTKTFHFKSLKESIGPLAICWSDDWTDLVHIKPAAGNVADALADAGAVWSRIFPDEAFTYEMLDENIARLYTRENQIASILSGFIVLALVLSSIGLMALSSATAEKRRKEIGIRKVNGAKIRDILLLLNWSYVKHLLISLLLSTPLSVYIAMSWNKSLAYKPEAGWWILPLAFLMVSAIALLTVAWQTWRASTANPAYTLRDE